VRGLASCPIVAGIPRIPLLAVGSATANGVHGIRFAESGSIQDPTAIDSNPDHRLDV